MIPYWLLTLLLLLLLLIIITKERKSFYNQVSLVMYVETNWPAVFKIPEAIWEFFVYASQVNSAKQAMVEA